MSLHGPIALRRVTNICDSALSGFDTIGIGRLKISLASDSQEEARIADQVVAGEAAGLQRQTIGPFEAQSADQPRCARNFAGHKVEQSTDGQARPGKPTPGTLSLVLLKRLAKRNQDEVGARRVDCRDQLGLVMGSEIAVAQTNHRHAGFQCTERRGRTLRNAGRRPPSWNRRTAAWLRRAKRARNRYRLDCRRRARHKGACLPDRLRPLR